MDMDDVQLATGLLTHAEKRQPAWQVPRYKNDLHWRQVFWPLTDIVVRELNVYGFDNLPPTVGRVLHQTAALMMTG